MNIKSSKAKGRRLQNEVSKLLNSMLGLDSRPAIMGEAGMDIKLSKEDQERFPFAIEAKCQERLNIWNALDQAERNKEDLAPAVVFKRNRSKIYIVIELETFLKMIRRF